MGCPASTCPETPDRSFCELGRSGHFQSVGATTGPSGTLLASRGFHDSDQADGHLQVRWFKGDFATGIAWIASRHFPERRLDSLPDELAPNGWKLITQVCLALVDLILQRKRPTNQNSLTNWPTFRSGTATTVILHGWLPAV